MDNLNFALVQIFLPLVDYSGVERTRLFRYNQQSDQNTQKRSYIYRLAKGPLHRASEEVVTEPSSIFDTNFLTHSHTGQSKRTRN